MHRRIRTKTKILLALAGLIFVGIGFLLSPYFHLGDITVAGNHQISTAEILERAGLETDTNFFLFNPGRARRQVMENLYIENVTFTRTLPNTLRITVQERFVSGFVEFMGDFVYIDTQGRVLEVRSYMNQNLPIITGLRFSNIRLGEILEVEDPAAFRTVVTYAHLLSQHAFSSEVSRIDVSNPRNARLRIYNVDVYLGDTESAAQKVLTLQGIIEAWPVISEVQGFLDLRDVNTQTSFFRLLT